METVVSYILVSFLNAGLLVVHGGRRTAGAARMVGEAVFRTSVVSVCM